MSNYKIVSNTLATRIRNVIPQMIHSDQYAYVKDRYIGDAVLIISDVTYHTDKTNSPGILLLCDFDKAFD